MKKIIFTCFIFFILSCKNNREIELTKQGNDIINRVYEYKEKNNNQLPISLADLGIVVKDESNPPVYYEKKDSIHFLVWFGTILGESKIYYSDSKKWENKYREMK